MGAWAPCLTAPVPSLVVGTKVMVYGQQVIGMYASQLRVCPKALVVVVSFTASRRMRG
jgi:hypothetical protein